MGKLVCAVCGRPFPQGQGIALELAGKNLQFHNKDCAYRFLRQLVTEVDSDCISGQVKRLIDLYEERLNEAAKSKQKKI
ncbi:hypothetical protein HS1genome_1037 [Sulfodiicoccus acidiphilus]|uniref:Uncharacterized protein n=1 Tax=Sulfodiicoccus acidiphilus TaxID=1670455 RepID=A0A348B396_9CREN|nr:hypothetical protein [Sulfodiicoccus acidiphilus]BBD72648.1 hypothetical protein HS1genome_1037 [Sulfodiicoccus acidiphilus]GGT95720.1 hypothetical protein GCM10007116_11670 [Sulfodiicoccus acidiphilus]